MRSHGGAASWIRLGLPPVRLILSVTASACIMRVVASKAPLQPSSNVVWYKAELKSSPGYTFG
jgi:hypothetical protein